MALTRKEFSTLDRNKEYIHIVKRYKYFVYYSIERDCWVAETFDRPQYNQSVSRDWFSHLPVPNYSNLDLLTCPGCNELAYLGEHFLCHGCRV